VRFHKSSHRPQAKVFSHAARRAPVHRPIGRGVRPALFYAMFACLLSTNVLTLVALLMAPDVSNLIAGKSDAVVAAYEDRISQLRIEVDRLHSRQFAQAGDINLQLQELTQQQELLLEQHQLVRQLADKAAKLGIETASLPMPRDIPEDMPQDGTAIPDQAAVTPASVGVGNQTDQIAAVSADMTRMMDESRLALAGIAESASESTDTIIAELRGIGIKPKLPEGLSEGTGGPYLPPVDGADANSIVDDANDVFLALARFQAARGAVDLAPVHKPLVRATRISSSFGNRTDPFTGTRAYHSGIDMPAPNGTVVMSAGYGKVTFVGQKAGYGNVVEVTHAAGLVTRYGHLSAFLVKEGQVVESGAPIAKVGSTGRSTGPHLHFEVRVKDTAVDPGKYLAVGRRLAAYVDT
jgi:murein DD-endopeptidase MepM/ murein hydrolase activator NlpD